MREPEYVNQTAIQHATYLSKAPLVDVPRSQRTARRARAGLTLARPRELPTRRGPLLSVLNRIVLMHASEARVDICKHRLILYAG